MKTKWFNNSIIMGFHNKVLCTHKTYINNKMKCLLNCIHCKIFQQKRGLKGYEKDDITENTKNQLLFIGVS